MPETPRRAMPLQIQLGPSPTFSGNYPRPMEPGIDSVMEFIEITSADAFGLQDVENAVAIAFRQRAAAQEIRQLRAPRNEVAAHIGFWIRLGEVGSGSGAEALHQILLYITDVGYTWKAFDYLRSRPSHRKGADIERQFPLILADIEIATKLAFKRRCGRRRGRIQLLAPLFRSFSHVRHNAPRVGNSFPYIVGTQSPGVHRTPAELLDRRLARSAPDTIHRIN